MIHQEIVNFLQRKKEENNNTYYDKWLRSKQSEQNNKLLFFKTTNIVKNCSEIIYLLVDNKKTAILMVQEFLHMIYSELGYQEIKLTSFYNNELNNYDPVSVKKVDELFNFMLPILKIKIQNSHLNTFFSITIRNIKNQVKNINVTYLTSVEEIKIECNRKQKKPIEDIVLIYKGKKLEDTILKYTGISENDTIYIVWIKKKKPVYVPPEITYYPSRAEETPCERTSQGVSRAGPAPGTTRNRFTVTNYYSSSDDEFDQLSSMYS